MKSYKIVEGGFLGLAGAILWQAIDDYIEYVVKERKDVKHHSRYVNKKELEIFFASGWADTLSFGNLDYILQKGLEYGTEDT